MNRKLLPLTIGVFLICAAGIVVLAVRPFGGQKTQEQRRTRIIIPRETNDSTQDSANAERVAYEDSVTIKAALNDGEIAVSVLNYDFDGDSMEEQIVAYRNLLESEGPVYISYIGFEGRSGAYQRFWNAQTAANRPGTVSLYTQDLVGDRNPCILVTGMNGQGEHTMTIFRRSRGQSQAEQGQSLIKIAEIRIEGSITVQETERSLAYQQGIANGQPYTIAAYGHDYTSGNILDQMEITYTFNQTKGLYEQNKITRVPGSQIEQRRLRELLSGRPGVFENFINDLWYYVSPWGTLDKSQYIYFDPVNREIIFFGDETQQVFNWQHSNSTRYGLYISSQNISVTTLRRFLDIELESLDSIRMRVSEDVRLKIDVNASWDGSYRRAGATAKGAETETPIRSYIDAMYDSSMGRLRFYGNGVYELSSGGATTQGRYVFFRANNRELLELRPEPATRPGEAKAEPSVRLVYQIEPQAARKTETGDAASVPLNVTLSRVRLGAMGIQDLHEGQITLTLTL